MSVDIDKLNVERPDHLNLHTLLSQVNMLSSRWKDVISSDFSAETFTVFSRMLHEIEKLSEEHRYIQMYEVASEMESTIIALGRNQGALNSSVVEYMTSCVLMLETLSRRLMDEAVKQAKHEVTAITNTASRVYILDENQQASHSLAVDIRGHGYQVLSFRCMDDLVHAVKFREPVAVLVFLEPANQGNVESESLNGECASRQEYLSSVMAISSGQVPCIAIGRGNDMASRLAAANAGVNSFYTEPLPLVVLVSELYSLQHTSMTQPSRLLLMSDIENRSSLLLEQLLSDAQMLVTRVSQLPTLVDQLVAGFQQSTPVDAVVLYDHGDEATLRQCFALLRQDPLLEAVPLFVVTENSVYHAEQFLRLIVLGSAGHFSMTDITKPELSTQLTLKIQSNTLRYRRQWAISDYQRKLEPGSGLLTITGFYQQCGEVLSTLESREGAPAVMMVVQVSALIRFADAAGLTDENIRCRVAHGLTSLLSPMDRVTALAVDQFALFVSQAEPGRYENLCQKIHRWFAHFSAQYAEDVGLNALIGSSRILNYEKGGEKKLQAALRDALLAVRWQATQKKSESEPFHPISEKTEMSLSSVPAVSSSAAAQPTPISESAKAANWSGRIKRAIKTQRLSLVFQPIVSLDMDSYERYEVLLRLNESGAVISPSEFMGTVNDAALINYIDRWVVATALKELRQANRINTGKSVFFIKLTAKTISDRSFVPWLKKAFAGSGVKPAQCVFEIPETILLESFAESQDVIRRIRDLGAKVSVSNVGKSDKSLSVLEYFDLDYVKLDRCFTTKEAGRWGVQLKRLIQEAKSRDVVVLAGFVENTESLLSIIQEGVGLVLGDFLQPPEPKRQFDFAINL